MATVEQLAAEQQAGNLVIDDKIRKSVARYVELEKRAKALNDEKNNEREQMEKLGIHKRAYQDEVRNFKLYDESERAAYMASRRRMQEVLSPIEKDMFAEEIDARNKRAAKKAAKDGNQPRTDQELNAQTDTGERSDPNAGGAKPQTGEAAPPTPPAEEKPKTIKEAAAASDAAVAKLIEDGKKGPQFKVVGNGDQADVKSNVAPPNPPGEAEEGEAALKNLAPQTAAAGAKKSQSQIAAEKAAAAGTDQPIKVH